MKPLSVSLPRLLLFVVLVLGGCSFRTFHPVVSQETAVSRDQAMLVMGVSFQEIYNDTTDALEKKLVSTDLLKDPVRLRKLLEDPKGTTLYTPLHYLSRFQFQFLTPSGEKHGFIRFDKDVREYEDIAIYEFPPEHVSLVNIATEQHHFSTETLARTSSIRWKKYWIDYAEAYGTWDLQAGRIAYLGHLTLYFKTERFIFGLLTPEEVVERIRLVAIVIEDRFDDTRQQLKKEKPWFPADEMINQAKPAQWIYHQDLFEMFTRKPGTGDDTDKPEPIRRDSKKYFF
ncbi:MAG: hypothetical protein ABIK68_05140 [bacterium]